MSVAEQIFTTRGFSVLVAVVFAVMLFVSAADLYLSYRRKPTIGEYVNAAVAARQWVAVLIALVFGAMIAHFFIYITQI
jgi:hypothetical protein